MNLGLFDVVGPIMHGPSSNHTGGANRIGYVASCLIGGLASEYAFYYHPIFMKMFTGHRTNIAMMAGCLGIREYDDRCNDAEEMMRKKNVSVTYHPIEGEETEPDRNTMRILADYEQVSWNINGISVGGGSILIDRINGISAHITGNCYVTLYLLTPGTLTEKRIDQLKSLIHPAEFSSGSTPEGDLVFWETFHAMSEETTRSVLDLLGSNIRLSRTVPPITPFAAVTGSAPLFTTFGEFLALCQNRPVIEVILDYEENRSGRSHEEILNQALEIVDVIHQSMERGRKGSNPLLCGYCSGSDGYMMDEWKNSGKSITGEVFTDAIAGALAMAEISASAGRVVAVPTSGSAGGLPGALFAVAKRYCSPKEELAKAFLVSAAVGAVIGNSCSFSGSIGGCQAEIGIGAGMAAAGCCYLAGGNAETMVHAAAMAIKNTLGLICDPVAGPVEVPCIKRNALGASVALMGAEMAMAGIRSVIPPDQVVIALADTQKRLPTELRGSCIGGLAAAPIAKELQEIWKKKLETSAAKLS